MHSTRSTGAPAAAFLLIPPAAFAEKHRLSRNMAPAGAKKRVLLIGGQFTGNFCARELKKQFYVTVVDCKEYFEYTPGVLRAFVRPAHLDSLTFTLQPVFERKMGVKFIWGEVKELNGDKKTASVKTMFSNNMDEIGFDYCIICSGCNFGPFKPMGESLWFPTVHEEARGHSDWKHIDERYLEGRRRHVLEDRTNNQKGGPEEYQKLHDLNKKQSTVLVVGAGFIGVVVCFSGIGFSHRILGLVAREGREVIQALSAAVSFLALFLYILLDIGKAPKKVWLPYAFVSFACVLALSISMSLDYSWASPFLCLQSSFVILGYMRSLVSTKDFFTATALSFSICGSVMLAIWIGVHFDLFTSEFDIFYAAKIPGSVEGPPRENRRNVELTSYLSRDLDLAFDYSSHCMSTNSSAYEQTVREALGAACGILNDVVQMQPLG
eukprot:s2630_g3.t1